LNNIVFSKSSKIINSAELLSHFNLTIRFHNALHDRTFQVYE